MLWKTEITNPNQTVLAGDTIATMFQNAVQQRGDRVEIKKKDFGIWKSVSWRELGQISQEIGMGLAALGFEPGERASILANTVKEWMFTDLAVLGAAGVVNGIYPTDSASQCEYLINDSNSVYVFVIDSRAYAAVTQDYRVRYGGFGSL